MAGDCDSDIVQHINGFDGMYEQYNFRYKVEEWTSLLEFCEANPCNTNIRKTISHPITHQAGGHTILIDYTLTRK